MPYSLSRKQLDRLNKGHPLAVALPPDPGCLDASHNWLVDEVRLLRWAQAQLPGLGRATVESATIQVIWLDCERPLGGLTEFYGGIVPDIGRHSRLGLPTIPVSVVVCAIVPNGYKGLLAERIQWPGSYVSPSGYTYGGNSATTEPPSVETATTVSVA